MGTVRREGDWRLEKIREGVYEITYRKEPQMKVLTPDRSERSGQQPVFDTLPVKEVSSFSEAEGLFEEKAHGPPPFGMEPATGSTSGNQSVMSQDDIEQDFDLSESPPGIFGIAMFIAGGFILYTFWDAGNQIALLLGVGFVGVGVAILGYGTYLFKSQGWQEGWKFFTMTLADGESAKNSSSSNTEKTPPAPQSLKDELYFERANRQCEYCGDSIEHFEVHHITPRSKGGENEPENLIVLCPNCHTKADRGSISKSRLRYQIGN